MAQAPGREPTTGAPVIEVRGITKQYGELTALDGVSFTVQPGEIFGILAG